MSVATPLLPGYINAPAEVSAEQLPTDDVLRAIQDATPVSVSQRWITVLAQASGEFDVPLPVLRAVLTVQSGGDPYFVNATTGAVGLMQVRPDVFNMITDQYGSDLTNAQTNVRVAADYLRRAYEIFGNWDFAYAAFSGAINLDRSTPGQRDPAKLGDVAEFRKALATQRYIENPAPINGTALDWAFDALGSPYVWGGVTLDGFDCQGLVFWAYQQVGVTLPRGTAAQWNATTRISAEELQPGDLVFFGGGLYHVGLYAGNGFMLHSPREGMTVEIVSLSETWWAQEIVGYGRVQ